MSEEAKANRHTRWSLRRIGLNAVALSLCWLILSGHYDGFHLALGVVSVGIVLCLNRDRWREPGTASIRPGRALLYLFWLAQEMILSAWQVAKVVLSPRMEINPGLVRFSSDQPNDLARVILGNSITLTPGTLTIDIDGDTFLVHHLTASTADDLLTGQMAERVAALYGPVSGRMVYDVERPAKPRR